MIYSESDHDILIEMRTDLKYLIHAHRVLKGEVEQNYVPRLNAVEHQQIRWIGRDGAIVAIISSIFSVVVIMITFWRG